MTVKSNCKLDVRIKSMDDIQTCLRHNDEFIGCKGYFFDDLVKTRDLSKCAYYGTLLNIDNTEHVTDLCFKAELKSRSVNFFRFFIPEKLLIVIAKKYRPFSIEEWKFKHCIGDTILYRYQGTYCGSHREAEVMYLGYVKPLDGITDEAGKGELVLGNETHDLQILFDNFEMWVDGGWKPFGVEE